MKNNLIFIRQLLLILTIICLYGCSQQRDESGTSSSLNPVIQQKIKSYIEQYYLSVPTVGISLAVVKDGKSFCLSSGYSQLADKIAFTDTTPIFMGNVSELITATAAIKLADMGKISLDDPVNKYLPYFELAGNTYKSITIRHLLTHTSGIPVHEAVWDIPGFDENALENTTRSIRLQEPEFTPPGSKVKRSPYNYDILADLISKAYNVSFEDFVKKNVFFPLKMKNSVYDYTEIINRKSAKAHYIDNWLKFSFKEDTIYPFNREHSGSIGFYGSANDMANWMKAILDGVNKQNEEFLSVKSHKELLMPQIKTNIPGSFIGLGWEIRKYKTRQLLTKSSKIGGYCTQIILIPDENTGIFVAANGSYDFNGNVICKQVLFILDGEKVNAVKIPVYIPMGLIIDKTGNIDEAFHDYARLRKDSAEKYDCSLEALSKLGLILMYGLHRNEDAERFFNACVGEFPDSVNAHLNLAEACILNKNIQKSKEELIIVKSRSPKDPEMKTRIAIIEEALLVATEKSK